MKLNKIFLMAGVAMTMFMAASCSDDDNWSAGPQTNADSLNVFIASDNNVVLSVDGNTFKVVYGRNNTKGSLTIPVDFSTSTPDIFTEVPASVTFADGQAFDTITITCKKDMEMFKTYRATITVPEQYTTQYVDKETNLPRAELNVVKEDYKPFKNGKYYSQFFGSDEDAVLEHSDLLGYYRFKNVVAGQTFRFVVDGENNIQFVEGSFETNYVHPSYGMISAKPASNKPSFIDPEDNTYYFGFEYTVSAGSFGAYYDYFVVAQ